MKVGDKVVVINQNYGSYGRVGEIVDFFNRIDIGSMKSIKIPIISFDLGLSKTAIPEESLELVKEPKPELIHLDLTHEEWEAFTDLLKMKANLELLERLVERAKKDD